MYIRKSNVLDVVIWQNSSSGKLIIVEIIKEELELLTLIHKLQQVHFIHVVSEYDCVIGWPKKLGRWI